MFDLLLTRYRGPVIAVLVFAAWIAGGATWHCIGVDTPAESR